MWTISRWTAAWVKRHRLWKTRKLIFHWQRALRPRAPRLSNGLRFWLSMLCLARWAASKQSLAHTHIHMYIQHTSLNVHTVHSGDTHTHTFTYTGLDKVWSFDKLWRVKVHSNWVGPWEFENISATECRMNVQIISNWRSGCSSSSCPPYQ